MSVIILYVLCSFLFKMRVLDSRLIFYFFQPVKSDILILKKKKKVKKNPLNYIMSLKKVTKKLLRFCTRTFFISMWKTVRENIDIKIKYHIYQLQLLLLSALFCHRSWSRPSRSPSAPANSNFQKEKRSKELEKTKRGLPL